MLNVFTYNVVVHRDERSYNCKTVENNRNWIQLMKKKTTVFYTKSKF